MKTLTKFILITTSVLSLAGCLGEDDKSYTEDANVVPRAIKSASRACLTSLKSQCDHKGVTCPNLNIEMQEVTVAPRIVNNTYKVLTKEGEEFILPVNECYIENKD